MEKYGGNAGAGIYTILSRMFLRKKENWGCKPNID
jgi:hypothetical protein